VLELVRHGGALRRGGREATLLARAASLRFATHAQSVEQLLVA
jgi:hypothetical protein